MTTTITLLNKINTIERELQEIKITTFLTLPTSVKPPSYYAEQALIKAAQSMREQIWQQQYAKKVKGVPGY